VSPLAPTLQAFFTDRLAGQLHASPNTVAGYRDTWRLLLAFTLARTGKPPAALDIADLDAPLIAAFLDHLEHDRGNSVRTRNNRLAAIHSLFAYAALGHPEHAASIQRVLAMPVKKSQRNLLTYLDESEVNALLAACDRRTWTGRRDHTMLAVAVQTGLRVSELTALRCCDAHLGAGAHVHCTGKGRRERDTPLLPPTAALLRVWLAERQGTTTDPLFPTRTGRALSRDAVEHRIKRTTAVAADTCPSIAAKHVTAHTLRHTAAMRLLLAGVDITVIALWLGHASPSTTEIYLHADMTQKERAIAAVTPPNSKPGRYHPPDTLLAFLEAL
jgi:integrase/recombinase XerD